MGKPAGVAMTWKMTLLFVQIDAKTIFGHLGVLCLDAGMVFIAPDLFHSGPQGFFDLLQRTIWMGSPAQF